jgi:hypothetical protein
MTDIDDLSRKVDTLLTKVTRLEFAILFTLVLMFLIFTFNLYLRR